MRGEFAGQGLGPAGDRAANGVGDAEVPDRLLHRGRNHVDDAPVTGRLHATDRGLHQRMVREQMALEGVEELFEAIEAHRHYMMDSGGFLLRRAENAKNEFTAGFQIGVQFQIKKLIFTGRYEGAFTEDQREFINNNSGQTIRYDNRPSLFIAGVGYEF